MNNPTKVKVNDKEYSINTDFRVALECNEIGLNTSIGEYERALAIIYKLFGKEALEDTENHGKLLDLAKKYLSCGKELDTEQIEPDMDFIQDYDYIKASFMSDYHIDLDEKNMHWWTFVNLINGLSNSELGNCCILNRIRNLRNFDTSQIKDIKEKEKVEKAKEQVALNKRDKLFTYEQQRNIEEFMKQANING